MIIDSLSQAHLYDSLNPRLAKAFDYLKTIDLQTVVEGRYPIDGDDIFMTVVDGAPLKSLDQAALEAHDKYIDIQVIVHGREDFGWKYRELCSSVRCKMDVKRDIVFYNDEPTAYVTLNDGEFIILFPTDAHAPMIGSGTVKKCIIKVLA